MIRPAAACLMALAVPVAAQEDRLGATVHRSLEMPGHRSLHAAIADPDVTLAPFETDGCSGGMSTTWRVVGDIFPDFADAHEGQPPWETCCVIHDHVYHDAGGTQDPAESYDARLKADEDLRSCVITHADTRDSDLAGLYGVSEAQVDLAYETIGNAMFNAVRFGGAPCSGLPWRWGYGYPGCVPGLP